MVHESVNFVGQNVLKLTYEHLLVKKVVPEECEKGRREEYGIRKETEQEKEGDGSTPPVFSNTPGLTFLEICPQARYRTSIYANTEQ
jgi:hypothetical protein